MGNKTPDDLAIYSALENYILSGCLETFLHEVSLYHAATSKEVDPHTWRLMQEKITSRSIMVEAMQDFYDDGNAEAFLCTIALCIAARSEGGEE